MASRSTANSTSSRGLPCGPMRSATTERICCSTSEVCSLTSESRTTRPCWASSDLDVRTAHRRHPRVVAVQLTGHRSPSEAFNRISRLVAGRGELLEAGPKVRFADRLEQVVERAHLGAVGRAGRDLDVVEFGHVAGVCRRPIADAVEPRPDLQLCDREGRCPAPRPARACQRRPRGSGTRAASGWHS